MISVNGVEISDNEIGHELQYHPAADEHEALNAAINALIVRQVLLQEAARLGLDKAAAVASETEDEATIRALIEQEITLPTASDDDCRQYFSTNRQKFQTTPLLEVSHILLSAHPDDDKERMDVKILAEGLIEKLQQKPDLFGRYVKDYSECPSKETKGSLGQLSKGQTVPEFERIVFALPEGISAYPVESRYGFHIVRVDRRVEGRPLEYDHVEERIRTYLNEKVERKAISQYIHILIGQADIQGVDMDIPESFLLQ